MKSVFRFLFRTILQYYPREYGKYTLLRKLYFPYLHSDTISASIVRMRAGFRLHLLPNELLQAHLYLFGTYELPTTNFIRRFLKKGDCVIDIGANIGYISLFCAQCVGKEGVVYAFEPEIKNYEALGANIALNGVQNIITQRLAVTEVETKLKLFLAEDNLGAHSTIYNEDALTQDYEEIDGMPLDIFTSRNSIVKIDLVKIDVEGAEYEVLKSMKDILQNQRPVIIMEFNNSLQVKRGLSIEKIRKEIFEPNKYQIFSTTESGKLIPFQDQKFENSVLLPDEKISQMAGFFS